VTSLPNESLLVLLNVDFCVNAGLLGVCTMTEEGMGDSPEQKVFRWLLETVQSLPSSWNQLAMDSIPGWVTKI
jgi:hypothetical protein